MRGHLAWLGLAAIGSAACARHAARLLNAANLAPDSAAVMIRGDRLDAVFPVAAIPSNGCSTLRGDLDALGRRLQGREHGPINPDTAHSTARFRWHVGYTVPRVPSFAALQKSSSAQLIEALRVMSGRRTEVFTEMAVVLPPSVAPTAARLDSAAARRAIAVWTTSGYPDGGVQVSLVEPNLRAVYFDHGRMHLALKGAAAVAAFLSLKPDTIEMEWCAPNGADTSISVPLSRR